MKKTIKLLLIPVLIILMTACLKEMTPSDQVDALMKRYINHDQSILLELDDILNMEDYSNDEKDKYRNIIKDNYSNLKYEIKDETIDGDAAIVEVELTTKDLYKSSREAENYMIEHPEEFYLNGVYSKQKFVDYKLGIMEKNTDTVTYTIYINLQKKDNTWVIEELDRTSLEKIHGIYNHEDAR